MSSFLLSVSILLLGIILFLFLAVRLMPQITLGLADKLAYKSLNVEQYNRSSAYNKLGFKPVHTECTDVELVPTAPIPDDIDGVFLRNGTNLQFPETRGRSHMFNGAGMLHQVQVRNGKASYTNVYVKTPRYRVEESAGKDVYLHFGDIAGGGKAGFLRMIITALQQRLGVIPKLEVLESGNNTTAIQFHHNKLYCLQETGYPFALEVEVEQGRLRLSGDGQFDRFGSKLDAPFTAHPKIDPATGDWFAFSTEFRSGNIYHSVLKKGELAHHSVIDVQKPAPAFVHDYFLTQNYLIFPDLSLRFSPKEMFGPQQSPMIFDPAYKMRWGVIRRDHVAGDPVRWFSTQQPGHLWHVVNGWEETRDDGGTDLVLFAPVFRSYPSNIPIHNPEEPHATFNKWRLNLESGEVTEDRELLNHFYERPSFNTAHIGRPARYAYLLDEEKEGMMAKGVLKYDVMAEAEVAYFDYGEYYGGEALFVPRKESASEDDGYLFELIMADDRAALLILDATTMTEVTRLPLPQRVPFGVHSCWLNTEQIAALA